MKTLKEIQDEIAIENGFTSWRTLSGRLEKIGAHRQQIGVFWSEVCRRAQLECGKATLDKAAKKAVTYNEDNQLINTESITSEENIVIIK